MADILKGKGNGSPTMRDALQAFSYINVISGQPSNTGVDDVISFLRKAPRTIQKLLTRRMQAQRAADYTDALTHAELKARKASASDPSGNAWLFALPTCPDTTIVSWKCREAILDRLAMPSVLLGAVAGYECVCFRGPTIDPVGDHARACPCAAKYQNRLHNKGTSLLSELAKNCGYATEMEQQKMFNGDRSRPDVTIFRYHPFMAKAAAIDLTFPCATAASNVGVAARGTGALANKAEVMKHSNYDWRTAPLSIAFYGGAMDSLGATGKGLRGVVSHLCMTSRHEFPGKNWASPSLERLF